MRAMFAAFAAVALVCAVAPAAHGQVTPVRTVFPLNTYVEIGLFSCSNTEGNYCAAGDVNGVVRAFLRFDPSTDLMTNYREEALLNNSFLTYNRELATADATYEYSLLATSNSLVCHNQNAAGVFSRKFLETAQYAGNTTTIRGAPVWEFTGSWYARGPLSNFTAWVKQQPPYDIAGWRSGGITYLYVSYQSWPQGFPADTFAPPNVDCTPPVPPPPPPPADDGAPGHRGLRTAGIVVSSVVAFEHVYFLILEMVLWRGRARKVFRTTEEYANATANLAANQGLYNGFLAAGIVYGLAADESVLLLFALACVVVAGVFGALTVGRTILFVQALPATLAFLFVTFGNRSNADGGLTVLWAALGVLGGGVVLGAFVCRREAARGNLTRQKLADTEAPSAAQNP